MIRIPPVVRRRWPIFLLGGLVLFAALSGASLGFFLRLDLPDIRALEDYTPPVMSVVLANDGSTVATFAEEKRILLEFGDIPQPFIEALIASEDSTFMRHAGVDIKGAFRAAWSDLRSRRIAQGASTLTMQLARNTYGMREKTLNRKLVEMALARRIEQAYSKEEILRIYVNRIFFGTGLNGIEQAARGYFGKPAADLDLVESAMKLDSWGQGLRARPDVVGFLPLPAADQMERDVHFSHRVDKG